MRIGVLVNSDRKKRRQRNYIQSMPIEQNDRRPIGATKALAIGQPIAGIGEQE